MYFHHKAQEVHNGDENENHEEICEIVDADEDGNGNHHDARGEGIFNPADLVDTTLEIRVISFVVQCRHEEVSGSGKEEKDGDEQWYREIKETCAGRFQCLRRRIERQITTSYGYIERPAEREDDDALHGVEGRHNKVELPKTTRCNVTHIFIISIIK